MEQERIPQQAAANPRGFGNGMSQEELSRVETRIAAQQENPVRGNYDLAHLQAIHAQTFRTTIGEAAGELRKTDLGKQGQDGVLSAFVAAKDLEQGGAEIAERIKAADNFRGLTKDEWSKGIAQTYADLNQLHPFRNGNDTANREFIRVLGREGGFEVDYAKVSVQDWQKASIESFKGNTDPVEKIFQKISEPMREIERQQTGRESVRLDIESSSLLNASRSDDRVSAEARRLGVEVMKPNELSTMEGNVKGVVISTNDDFTLVKTSATKALAIDKDAIRNLDIETGKSVVVRRENDAIHLEAQPNAKERSNEQVPRFDRTYGER